MTFVQLLTEYYEWYEIAYGEHPSGDDKVALEEFAEWLDKQTDSTAKE